jgi:hypothetical protein
MLGAVEHLQRATQANGEVDSEPGQSPRHGYLNRLKRDFGIVGAQAEAWQGFAATLRANARRMSAAVGADPRTEDVTDLAFGELQDRLVALAAMQLAAADLLATLTPAQGGRAARVLPLCCLPAAARS